MARKEIQYICEVCDKRYLNEEKAIECENTHYKVVEITKVMYDSCEVKKEFPATINVKLKNGQGVEKNYNL